MDGIMLQQHSSYTGLAICFCGWGAEHACCIAAATVCVHVHAGGLDFAVCNFYCQMNEVL